MGDAGQVASPQDVTAQRERDPADDPKFAIAFARRRARSPSITPPSGQDSPLAPVPGDAALRLKHDDPLLAGPSSRRGQQTAAPWRAQAGPPKRSSESSHPHSLPFSTAVTPSATLSPSPHGAVARTALPSMIPPLPAPSRPNPTGPTSNRELASDFPSSGVSSQSFSRRDWPRTYDDERSALAYPDERHASTSSGQQQRPGGWSPLAARTTSYFPSIQSVWSPPSASPAPIRPSTSFDVTHPPSHVGDQFSTWRPASAPRTRSPSSLSPVSPPASSRNQVSPVPRGELLKSGLPAAPNRSPWTLWVGNIPSNSTQEELWDFFSARTGDRDAGVESIHLMGRSNCAFVNYHLERHLMFAVAACSGVPLRPEDKRSKLLLCRIRQREDDAKSGVGAQRGGGIHKQYVKEKIDIGLPLDSEVTLPRSAAQRRDERADMRSGSESSTSSFFEEHFPKRFFVLKAHNVDDLKESVSTGLWRTQVHNEHTLNQAYRTAKEGVFIIFSANKSGEWFGYAKLGSMVGSGISSDDDGNALGSPFQIIWIRVKRVPFGKTRHLLNSFNSNREVKISRDGTEIEPATGERLLQMF